MIFVFTDFGHQGAYVGEMTAVLHRHAPEVPAVELMADAPTHDPRAAAYLLAACLASVPAGSVLLCVVDPGVGGDRAPGILRADGRTYVGPDNGLFELVIRRAVAPPAWADITWRPPALSRSFHGRDLFAPVAARLARGLPVDARARPLASVRRQDWPDDLHQVVHVDRFGNAITGMRASGVDPSAALRLGGMRIPVARTFSDVPPGSAFWYKNSNGLVEIAVNRGRADTILGANPGTAFDVDPV